MRKASLVCLLFIMGSMVVPASVGAQAVVIKDDMCTFLDQDHQTFFSVPMNPDEVNLDLNSIKVITPSKNCNKNVSCHAGVADGSLFGPPAEAIVFDYDSNNHGTAVLCVVKFQCIDETGTLYDCWFSTPNWHETTTPKGNISLTCHFKDCDVEPCFEQPNPDGTCGGPPT